MYTQHRLYQRFGEQLTNSEHNKNKIDHITYTMLLQHTNTSSVSAIVRDYFRWVPPAFSADDVSLELYEATVGSDLEKRFPVDSQYCSR